MDTYFSAADANADRELQLKLLDALKGWPRALRRDECGAWVVRGKHGVIHTWGDGETWIISPPDATSRQETCALHRLDFCRHEPGWRVRLMNLPTPEQAKVIRDVLGIRKRVEYCPGILERKRASIKSASRAAGRPKLA